WHETTKFNGIISLPPFRRAAIKPERIPMPTDEQYRTLQKKVEELTAHVSKLQDTQAVRDLQFKYGYYLDKCLYDEAVDLYTDDCEVHFLGGIFRGKESARRLYCGRFREIFTDGHNGP